MNEATKTIAFLAVAAATLVAAIFTGYANQPKPADDYETIGQGFYTDFEQTDQAKSLVVTSIDPDTIREQKFEIKQVAGLWQIPSHEGYPAEAAERLAKTSASLVGLTRDSLVGRRTSDYEKFGVVDPRTKGIVDMESVGQSITLRDANDDVLVDLIIGNRADKDSAEGEMRDLADDDSYYYVRRADETNVYRIPLNIDLSTKFADWIEPDLLQLDAADVVRLNLNNYQIEEQTGGMFGQVKQLLKVTGDELAMTRSASTDDWGIEDLDPAKETVQQDAINAIISVLDEMAIVDVKKKPTLDGRILLDAELNYNVTPEQASLMSIRTQRDLDVLPPAKQAEFQALQRGITELQRDLNSRGFSFGQTGQKLELVSTGGDMQAGTSDGLLYTLHVGKPSTQKGGEIEVAGAKQDGKDSEGENEDSEDKESEEGESETKDEENVDASEEGDSSRYVLIRVAFDPTLMDSPGEKPAAPTAPTKPDGYTEAATETPDQASDADSADADATDDDSAPKPANMERKPAFAKYDADLAAYEQGKVDFEVAVSTWEKDTEAFKEEEKLGKRKAEILNGRFEKWYYIVSSENLKTLQSDRASLTEPVVAAAAAEPDNAALEAAAAAAVKEAIKARPDVSFPTVEIPGEPEVTEPEVTKPEVTKPEVTEPAAKEATETAPVEKPPVDAPTSQSANAAEVKETEPTETPET